MSLYITLLQGQLCTVMVVFMGGGGGGGGGDCPPCRPCIRYTKAAYI